MIFLLMLGIVAFSACTDKTKPVDKAALKDEITKVMDKIYQAYEAKDLNAAMATLTDDAVLYGTDPGECWDKASYGKAMTEMFSDTSQHFKFKVDKREIYPAADGKSAIVVDQYLMVFSQNIPVRHVFHFVKVGEAWVSDFQSSALTPRNDDLGKINDAVK